MFIIIYELLCKVSSQLSRKCRIHELLAFVRKKSGCSAFCSSCHALPRGHVAMSRQITATKRPQRFTTATRAWCGYNGRVRHPHDKVLAECTYQRTEVDRRRTTITRR